MRRGLQVACPLLFVRVCRLLFHAAHLLTSAADHTRWCPEEGASWLDIALFSYATPLIRRGYAAPLQVPLGTHACSKRASTELTLVAVLGRRPARPANAR